MQTTVKSGSGTNWTWEQTAAEDAAWAPMRQHHVYDFMVNLMADPNLIQDQEVTTYKACDVYKDGYNWEHSEIIKQLAGKHTIIVIDHDMGFVEQLGASVSVLHLGKLFKEGSVEEVRNDPGVVEIYLGRAKEKGLH